METCGIPETARLLDLPPPAVRAMIEEGALEARQVDGRWRVTRYAIERARVRLQHPGPQPMEAAERLVPGTPHTDLERRLDMLEARLDRIEGRTRAADGDAGTMRPALAHLFQPETS
jgi:hypothetical protein